jgi:PAS domain S-box-containing protein
MQNQETLSIRPQLAADPLRVLVADDIAASRLALCELLRQLGHEPVGVDSGHSVLEQVEAQPPDLVLLDLLMPGLDGFEVARRLRRQSRQHWMPVIVTSSLEGEEHLIQALACGADDYLVRPVSPAMLEAKLRHYARVLGLQSGLAALARRQRAIHDNILDAVITLGTDGLIEQGNLAAGRLFGRPGQDLAGRHCEPVLGQPLRALLAQRELELRRGDGTLFPAELALSDWREHGQVQYTLVIRDLTGQRHVARMKDEFLATVSHELRTPLTSVLGALGLLASGAVGALPEAAERLTEVARRNGERLGRLIDDLLDLTKLEGQQMALRLRTTPLDDLLREAIQANQAYAQRAGVELGLALRAGSPPVRVDGDRFLQVMANLLSNAVKHSAAGGRVRVGLDGADRIVRVTVRDDGPGIDPRFRARMFEKFSQADGSDQRVQGGTGLGLYLCRLFVERMGGRIGCDSTPGQGATFWIELESACLPGAAEPAMAGEGAGW